MVGSDGLVKRSLQNSHRPSSNNIGEIVEVRSAAHDRKCRGSFETKHSVDPKTRNRGDVKTERLHDSTLVASAVKNTCDWRSVHFLRGNREK